MAGNDVSPPHRKPRRSRLADLYHAGLPAAPASKKGGFAGGRPETVSRAGRRAGPKLTVHINLPDIRSKLRRIKKNKPAALKAQKKLFIGGLVIILLGAAVLGWQAVSGGSTGSGGGSPKPATPAAVSGVSFKPLLPYDSKTGKTKTLDFSNCPQKSDTICFSDRFLGVEMVVTEQKLPADLRANPAKLKNIADSLKGAGSYREAKSSNGRGYVISYQDIAPQRVVFATADLLIFIQSSQNLEIGEWQHYFETLTPAN